MEKAHKQVTYNIFQKCKGCRDGSCQKPPKVDMDGHVPATKTIKGLQK